MQAVKATPNCLGVDTLQTMSKVLDGSIAMAGFKFRAGYIDHMTAQELSDQLASGLAYIPVTYADEWDGDHAVRVCRDLGLPLGTTVFLDVESVGPLDAPTLIAKINLWASKICAAGYRAGLYIGCASVLTYRELYDLPQITCYWLGCSILTDRNEVPQIPYPRGFAMVQGRPPNTVISGGLFDVDFLTCDCKDGVPYWVTA